MKINKFRSIEFNPDGATHNIERLTARAQTSHVSRAI